MSDSRSDDAFEDISESLAGPINTNLRDPRSLNALQDVNGDSGPPALLVHSELNLMPDFTPRFEFNGTIIHHGQSSSRDAGPQNLLRREFTDQDALFQIYPSAKLKNNCIGVPDYICVVRLLLFQWKISACHDNSWLSSGVLGNPHSYAHIFRRLGAELKFVSSEDGRDSRYHSDSRRLYACLGDLEEDMFKAYTLLGSKDGEVEIFTETESYEDCLRSIVKALDNCSGAFLYLSHPCMCRIL